MRTLLATLLAWTLRPRLLPMAVAAMLLLAAVKLVVLAQGINPFETAGRAVLPSAHASAPKPAAAAPHTPPPPQPAPPPEPAAQAEPGPSDAERALLQDLRARRVALDARDQSIAAREALLAAAERRLTDRVEQLAALQTRLEALDQTRRDRDEANWRGLVKTYEAMRPRDAAAILNELEQPVLMQVLDRMKEAKAAPILAAMPPERARAATAQLAQWRTREPGRRE